MVSDALGSVQALLLLVLSVAVLGLTAYAFIDASRQRADAYTAAGKLTKNKWLGITGVALAIAFIFFVAQLNGGMAVFAFPNIIALVAAGVYLADVRPAIRQISGGGNAGPYGRW